MKKLLLLVFLIFSIYCIVFYAQVISLTKQITLNFILNIIPSLLPLLFLTNMLINTKLFFRIININKVFKELSLIIITLLLGAPACILFLNKLEQESIISHQKKCSLASSFGTFSFSYLCFLFVFEKNNYAFLCLLLISELIVYLFFSSKEIYERKEVKLILQKKAIMNSINETIKTLTFIYFSTLFMNLLFINSQKAYETMPHLIMLFEFSYAGKMAKDFTINYQNEILLLIASLGAISIWLQLYYLDAKYPLFMHIKRRTYVALLSMLFLFVFFL